ncbi:glycosyltransferase [Chitinophaga varians]|uniref:glycosyltransferase n=1 Tax=Chitinophaga varians TaxID=2202339 RepID=UPI00165F7FB0|nr:glycosyltransferase family 2 protein [Chitinophaga varians]MBC9913410.1 glycosyltransferase family 2 protein [Chitinophaga varians]
MSHLSVRKHRHFSWVGSRSPHGGKKVALLIPQYNEGSNPNFTRRLAYFQELWDQHHAIVDVILIDDGSTDESLQKMQLFASGQALPLYVASVFPNANKVGALYTTILSLSHEFIILSDFDTDIMGLEKLLDVLSVLDKDSSLMGGYFRMLPFEGRGAAFRFQQLEYALLRTLYKFHQKDQSVPVMPGAGCCYRRDVLISIYRRHSGLRNGEDREATLLGLKMGYGAQYMNDIQTLTRPPLSFKALVKQRVRWYLGYLETLYKERTYYYEQVRKRTPMGIRTVLDILTVGLILSTGPLLLITGLLHPLVALGIIAGIYLSYTLGTLYLMITSPRETGKISLQILSAILLFPLMKISLEYLAWIRAFIVFRKKRATYKQSELTITDIYTYQQVARETQESMDKRVLPVD